MEREFNLFRAKPMSIARLLLINVAIAIAYFLTAHLSLKLAFINQSVSPVWPPTGVAILVAIAMGNRVAVGIFIGAFCANIFAGAPALPSLLIAFGNTCEAVLGAYFFVKIFTRRRKLEELTFISALAITALLAPVVSASIGTATLNFFSLTTNNSLGLIWATWWAGDALGAFLILPFIFLLSPQERSHFSNHVAQLKLKSVLIIAVSGISIFIASHYLTTPFSLRYLFVVFIGVFVFSGFQNRIFLFSSTFLLSLLIVLTTSKGFGPFSGSETNQNLLHLNIFLGTLTIISSGLASYFRTTYFKVLGATMLCGLTMWGVIFFFLQESNLRNDKMKIQAAIAEGNAKVESAFNSYFSTLAGGAALYMASENVDHLEWKHYCEHLQRYNILHGVRGIGVVNLVKDKDLSGFVKRNRQVMDSNFQIRSLTSSRLEDHYIITYIEPIEQNRLARGLDLGSEGRRAAAARLSMRTGNATISETIQLIQDEVKQPGFLIYLPVYKKGSDIDSDEARIANFSHWIYAPVTASDFFTSALKNFHQSLHLEIYEAEAGASPLFESKSAEVNPNYQPFLSKLSVGERNFNLRWQVTKDHIAESDFISTWIGLIGASTVLIVAIFIVSLLSINDKAQSMATKLNISYMESERKLHAQEAKVAESAKMASLGEMAGGIAHEINNPLAILSATIMQIDRALTNSAVFAEKEKTLAYVQRLNSTVHRISKIIKNLRHFARDGQNDPMVLVSLSQIIEDTLSLCSERFRNAEIPIKLDLKFDGKIECREVQISQVLLNLLGNSFDAIEDRSEKWVKIETFAVDNTVFIRVSDSGRGISLEVQNKMLNPFFTTKEVGKGTGLGLSISNGIIESHSGKLRLDNDASNTTFVIQIPIYQNSTSSEKKSAA